jgi:pathogenesis-related protein 1
MVTPPQPSMAMLLTFWFCTLGVVGVFLDSRGSGSNLGEVRTQKKTQSYGHVVEDSEATVLDFSALPSNDLSRNSLEPLSFSAPFEANPKNGTPWFRYTKTAGRGQANHSHFGGLTASGDFSDDILSAHNVVRERARLQPLQWHARLAEMASARALKLANEGCYIQHSPTSDRWYEAGFHYIGENLYKVINMKPTGVDIVDAWYAEIEDYSYGRVGSTCVKERCAGRSSPPCTLGHFTQVMWSDSTHVGCARAECPGQAKRTFVAVCNYGPGGNIVGSYPFPAINSAAIGLSQQDCDMRRKPEPTPSLWESVEEGRVPEFRNSGGREASAFLFLWLVQIAALRL